MRKKEQKERRETDLREGLRLYKYSCDLISELYLSFAHAYIILHTHIQFYLSTKYLVRFLSSGRSGNYEQALEKFESVLGSKPEPNDAAVASYNVACCYSKLNQVS